MLAMDLGASLRAARLAISQDEARITPIAHSTGGRVSRLHVGVLSSNLGGAIVGLALVGVLELLNSSSFSVTAYSTRRFGAEDLLAARIKRAVWRYRHVEQTDDTAVAQLVKRDQAHLLLNFNGLTTGHRTRVVLAQPAPVQAQMYGDSTAIGSIRQMYQYADSHVASPAQLDPLFQVEKIVMLPWCYHAASHDQGADVRATIGSVGDSSDVFANTPDKVVLASFNRQVKLDPSLFSAWIQATTRAGAGLYQLIRPTQAKQALEQEARARGCDTGTCFNTMLQASPLEYASRLKQADLALDTVSWSGQSTTLDVLWEGTPMAAVVGQHMSSRFALSAWGAFNKQLPVLQTLKELEDGVVDFSRV
eukprot:TRINITY_DN28120_c0_g1_i1.p1 TRINITY_DN28120_c0_g1~~TRINITY_DN28120_c0_g1_i1.p1  ORF type:complete len:364 (-),score=60.24 TRINITY_DN28120_c0_g1_i1:52-1143(-)